MKIKFTAVISEGLFPIINPVLRNIESKLNVVFVNNEYALDQFIVVVVAVDSSDIINLNFCKGHNSSGKYKDPFTMELIRFMSIALPFNPDILSIKSKENLNLTITNAFLERLSNIDIRVPKGFDLNDFRARCANLARVDIASPVK